MEPWKHERGKERRYEMAATNEEDERQGSAGG